MRESKNLCGSPLSPDAYYKRPVSFVGVSSRDSRAAYYNDIVEMPLLTQPETEGFGPPRFEFDPNAPGFQSDYESLFHALDMEDTLDWGPARYGPDANEVLLTGTDRQMVLQLIVREKGAPRDRAAHELSFEATLRYDEGSGYELKTPEGTEAVKLTATSGAGLGGRLDLSFSFAGLPVASALSLARFAKALYRTEGTLYLRDAGDGEELTVGDLPTNVPASVAEENDDRLSALEALSELEGLVGERLTIPPSGSNRDALRAVSALVDAVRSGTAVLPVAGFDVPVPAATVREFLGRFDERGELELAWGAEGQAGPIDVLGPEIFLGPCRYVVQGARLVNAKAELEAWLSRDPRPGDAMTLSWQPLEGYPVLMQYLDWPKPSRAWVQVNIEAFEEANGVDSAAFERAYRGDEAWTDKVDRADIWMTLIDSRRAMLEPPESADGA